jgi:hypothetical protein
MHSSHSDHDALDAPYSAPRMDDVMWQTSLAAAPKTVLTVFDPEPDFAAGLQSDAAGHS